MIMTFVKEQENADNPDYYIIAKNDDGKPMGILNFRYAEDATLVLKRNVEVKTLWVFSGYRRKGVATELLKFLEGKIQVLWISLWTGMNIEVDNGYELFNKAGYTEACVLPDYYASGVATRLFVKRLNKHDKIG